MAKLSRDWKRRRWILALLFILLMTVSMMGPTQALSGVKNASSALIETLAAIVDSDSSTLKPTASAARTDTSQWFDDALSPDFIKLVTESPGEVDSVASGATDKPTAAISGASSASSDTTQDQADGGVGGFGNSGRPHLDGGARSSLGLGGGAAAPIEALAATGQAVAEELALIDTLSDPMVAFDPGVADDSVLLPGGLPGGSGSGGLATQNDPASEPPATGSEAPILPTTPYADGTVPPVVIEDLLDDLDVPGSLAADTAANRTSSGFELSQVPEPATLVLLSLGLAALRHRSRERFSRQ